jgi:hypothetical protein
MGAVPVQEAKWAWLGNRAHFADVGEDPCGTGGADAVDVHQVRPARQDGGVELGLHRLELGVQVFDAGQFPGGHPAAGSACQVPRPHAGQQCLVLGGGLLHRRPAGNQFQEQPVHPVQRPGAGLREFVTAVAQQPQHRQVL